jgi:hypothetical protein
MSEQSKKKEKGDRLWFRAALFLVPRMVSGYFRLVDLTSRKIFINRDYEEKYWKGAVTVAGFHGALLFAAYYCRKHGGAIMVSKSWDGELGARCLQRWGYFTPRGSSSKGGKEALGEMVRMMNERQVMGGMAVDAPRGPAGKAKIGAVVLARDTGGLIAPIANWTTRHIQFNSWDKMILPLPFSTIVIAFGKPVAVPPGLTNDDYERIRQETESSIADAVAEAQAKVRALKPQSGDAALEPAEPVPPVR